MNVTCECDKKEINDDDGVGTYLVAYSARVCSERGRGRGKEREGEMEGGKEGGKDSEREIGRGGGVYLVAYSARGFSAWESKPSNLRHVLGFRLYGFKVSRF